LRYRRALEWFLSETQRTQEAPFSPAPPPRSGTSSTPSDGTLQNAEPVEVVPGCKCSRHTNYPKPSSLLGGLLVVLSMGLLLTGTVPHPASSGWPIGVWSAAALAFVSVTVKNSRQRLSLARRAVIVAPSCDWEPQFCGTNPSPADLGGVHLKTSRLPADFLLRLWLGRN